MMLSMRRATTPHHACDHGRPGSRESASDDWRLEHKDLVQASIRPRGMEGENALAFIYCEGNGSWIVVNYCSLTTCVSGRGFGEKALWFWDVFSWRTYVFGSVLRASEALCQKVYVESKSPTNGASQCCTIVYSNTN